VDPLFLLALFCVSDILFIPTLVEGAIMAKATDELHWRETYFILFPRDRRPQLETVAKALSEANARYRLNNLAADDGGLLQSLLVESHEDHAAIEISYEFGENVIEQSLEWAKLMEADLLPDQLQEMIKADARLDVAHFERVPAGGSSDPTSPTSAFEDDFDADEENYDLLDPTCLLTVVDALSQLTHGLTVDPASGEILS
jgi:hypothetical protein